MSIFGTELFYIRLSHFATMNIGKIMQTISEKIKQRRKQILVHSYIYYELNDNIVSDHKWASWAKELQTLQSLYPKESKETEYADEFKNFDGSSGAFLNFDENIKKIANHLLNIKNKKEMR